MSDITTRYKWLDENSIVLKQHRDEIGFVYEAAHAQLNVVQTDMTGINPVAVGCQTFVEVGSMAGASLYVYGGLVESGGLAIAIDDGRRFKHRRSLKRVGAALSESMRYEWLRGDSHAPSTLEALQAALGGRKIDFLHIDGDHSAAGSLADWEMYGPLVRQGGIVAFHDIRATTPCHVDTTWRSICDTGAMTRAICCGRFKSTATSRLHKACGIGLVYV